MAGVITEFRFRDNLSFWNPWQILGRRTMCDGNCNNDANRLLLLLYAYNMVLEDNVIIKEGEVLRDENVISVKQYSNAVRQGK